MLQKWNNFTLALEWLSRSTTRNSMRSLLFPGCAKERAPNKSSRAGAELSHLSARQVVRQSFVSRVRGPPELAWTGVVLPLRIVNVLVHRRFSSRQTSLDSSLQSAIQPNGARATRREQADDSLSIALRVTIPLPSHQLLHAGEESSLRGASLAGREKIIAAQSPCGWRVLSERTRDRLSPSSTSELAAGLCACSPIAPVPLLLAAEKPLSQVRHRPDKHSGRHSR